MTEPNKTPDIDLTSRPGDVGRYGDALLRGIGEVVIDVSVAVDKATGMAEEAGSDAAINWFAGWLIHQNY